jgi:hypothetical protein
MKPFQTKQVTTCGLYSPNGKREYFIVEPFIKLCDEDGRPMLDGHIAHLVTPCKPIGSDDEGCYYAAPVVVIGTGMYSLFIPTPEIDIVDDLPDTLFDEHEPSQDDIDFLFAIQKEEAEETTNCC